jgi:hypothetical protein
VPASSAADPIKRHPGEQALDQRAAEVDDQGAVGESAIGPRGNGTADEDPATRTRTFIG